MQRLLLITLLVLLAACSGTSVPDNSTPDAIPEVGLGTAVFLNTPTAQPAPASPTPLPLAEYDGVSFIYDTHLLGEIQSSGSQPPQTMGNTPAQPEKISFSFSGSALIDSANLHVYPIDHYSALSEASSNHIAQLERLIRNRSVQPNSPLPLYPSSGSAQVFESEPDYVKFANGQGIGFVTITKVEGENAPCYAFQGITDDGTLLITATIPFNKDGYTIETVASADESLTQVVNTQVILNSELQGAQKALSESMRSLEILPEISFSSPAPEAYASFPGLLFGYDPEFVGEVSLEKKPPVYSSTSGKSTFLAGVPDALEIFLDRSKNEEMSNSSLKIIPVRGATGQYYPSIPPELKKEVEKVEREDFSESINSLTRPLAFQSGLGMRSIKQLEPVDDDAPKKVLYDYRGVTGDGRYFVIFNHLLQIESELGDILSLQFLNQLSMLDSMMESLVVAEDASTDSSMPDESTECIQDAQFLDDVTIPDHTIIERGETARKIWKVRNTGTCTWTPAYQIVNAGGNPVTWKNPSVLDVVAPGGVTEISVEILSPEIPGNYHAWWQLADDMGSPFGPFYYTLFESPRPATEIPGHGVIEGSIGYPAGGIPSLTIYFMSLDGSERYALETKEGWNRYANEIPVGEYYVFARVSGDESDSGGGYTKAVECDLTCENHELIPVTIEEGKTTRDINIVDWYAPAGSFPLPE